MRWGGGHEDAVQKMSYRNDSNARRQCEWVICPKCGWNIVTTKIDDIMLDTQLYQLYILKNEHINRNQIRILSKISGMNYICIKQNIVTRNKTLLISDRAFKIKAIKEMLEKEKIQFEVVPEFKY